MEESEDDIKREFAEFVNDATGSVTYLLLGLAAQRERIESLIAEHRPGPQNRMYIGRGGPPNSPGAIVYQAWPISTLPERLAKTGPVARSAGSQWLIYIYAEWDESIRPRIAQARGVTTKSVIDPIMGDMRLIRHDILHNRGVASRRLGQRLEVLRWFKEGDQIFISEDHIQDFVERMGLARRGPM